jgi:hypothetical protein
MTGAHHHAQFLLVEMGSHQFFAQAGLEPRFSQSPLQVGKIARKSRHAQPRMIFDERKDTSFIITGRKKENVVEGSGRHIDLGVERWNFPAKISIFLLKAHHLTGNGKSLEKSS